MEIHQYIQPILNYFTHHKVIGLIATFVIAFLEALPIIGTLIPGSVTMTLIGVLVGTGILPGYLTFILACIGAYLGDWVGFLFGYYFQDRITLMWPFKKHPKWLQAGRHFFEKHGVKSVIIGRFFGPIRSTVPMVAGILNMNRIQFFFAAIPAAIIWAICYMGPGILLGQVALELSPAATTKIILYGVLIIVILWFIFWVIEHFFLQITQAIDKGISKIWHSCIQRQWLSPVIKLIQQRQNPNSQQPLSLLILAVLLLTGVAFLLSINVLHGPHNAINLAITHLMQGLRQQTTLSFAILLTNVGYFKITLLMFILLSTCLVVKGYWREAICLLFAAFCTVAVVGIIKHFFFSPRPQWITHVKSTSSLPSGHTAMATIWYSSIAYFSTLRFKSARFIIYSTVALCLLTALSRLYIGAHWLTDVTASLLIGNFVLCLMIILYQRLATKEFTLSRRYWLSSIALAFFLPWSIYSWHNLRHEIKNSQIIHITQQIKYKEWRQNPLQLFPVYRKNRLGHDIQPLNVQWLDPLNEIKTYLTSHGFKAQERIVNLKSGIINLTKKENNRLPLMPWLYKNQPPVLLMTKPSNNSNTHIEIRLWHSHTRILRNPKPLWVGAINYRTINTRKLIQNSYSETHYHYQNKSVLNMLTQILPPKSYRILIQPRNKNKKIKYPTDWNHNVIIISLR